MWETLCIVQSSMVILYYFCSTELGVIRLFAISFPCLAFGILILDL